MNEEEKKEEEKTIEVDCELIVCDFCKEVLNGKSFWITTEDLFLCESCFDYENKNELH